MELTKKNKRKILPIIASVIGIILIAAAVTILVVLQKNKERKYLDNYDEITELMIEGIQDAENVIDTCRSVWYNTIFEERDEKTDMYTMTNGVFNDDFNDSINALYDDTLFYTKILEIQGNILEVEDLYSIMKKAPKKYKDEHEDLEEFYDIYNEITDLAMNPKGNLTSYTEKANELKSDATKLYKRTQRNLGWE